MGHFLVSLGFEEDFSGLFTGDSTRLRSAPKGPEEPMSMERLSVHIARFQSVTDCVSCVCVCCVSCLVWHYIIFILLDKFKSSCASPERKRSFLSYFISFFPSLFQSSFISFFLACVLLSVCVSAFLVYFSLVASDPFSSSLIS